MLRGKLFKNVSNETEETKQVEVSNTELLDLTLQNCHPADVSKYFPNAQLNVSNTFPMKVINIHRALNNELSKFNFFKPPIQYIYNPTEYASEPFELYIQKYCQESKKLLFVGMNPGPFGMCQTGVPFGDTNWVKNWLGIEGNVYKPLNECPDRLIYGFSCTRKEQSGDRFWKFWSELCGQPEKFFCNAFVHNYCPLAFMDAKGRNLTPADIKDKKELESICDQYYLELIKVIEPQIVIAIGGYIEKRVSSAFKASNVSLPVICLPHPSPRAVNNNNWPEKAKNFLLNHQLMKYFQ